MSTILWPLVGMVALCLVGALLARSGWGRYLSAPAIIIVLAALLANFTILPVSAELNGAIITYVVPGAVSLLLVHANLRRLWQTAGPLMLLFLLATTATLVAALAASVLVAGNSDLEALIPVFAATYIGGSVNFVAASQPLAAERPELVAAALAADAIVGVSYLIGLAILSAAFGSNGDWDETVQETATTEQGMGLTAWLATPLALLLAVAVVSLAQLLAQLSGATSMLYLFIIGISVTLANIFPNATERLRIAPTLGVAGMYLFFAVVGSSTQLSTMTALLLPFIGLAAFIVLVHAAVFFTVGRYLVRDMPSLMTVSNACILGPATAAAVASSRGWHHLVAAGTLCGVLGYAIANFVIYVLI